MVYLRIWENEVGKTQYIVHVIKKYNLLYYPVHILNLLNLLLYLCPISLLMLHRKA